jgi:hypothetical protein
MQVFAHASKPSVPGLMPSRLPEHAAVLRASAFTRLAWHSALFFMNVTTKRITVRRAILLQFTLRSNQ